jgi:hypothetical protein
VNINIFHQNNQSHNHNHDNKHQDAHIEHLNYFSCKFGVMPNLGQRLGVIIPTSNSNNSQKKKARKLHRHRKFENSNMVFLGYCDLLFHYHLKFGSKSHIPLKKVPQLSCQWNMISGTFLFVQSKFESKEKEAEKEQQHNFN